MKKVLFYATIGILLVSCNPCDGCEDVYTHTVAVRNQSEENFKVLFYDNVVVNPQTGFPPFLREEIIIETGSSIVRKYKDVFVRPPYYSFTHNFSDSIVLKFDNGKGYYTTLKNSRISVDYWLQDKSSFFTIDGNDLINVNGVLTYLITQQDYENAHILP
jgi:hypothetical protein